MALREFILWSLFTYVTTMICYVDSIVFHERARWIALGDEINKEDDNYRSGTEVDRYNMSLPVSTMAEVAYRTKNGKRINCIIASASHMNGYVSLEKGGLEEDHVTIRYITENGTQDEFFLFIESYKIEPFVLNDNLAKTRNVAVVMNDIRNWTRDILQQFIQERLQI